VPGCVCVRVWAWGAQASCRWVLPGCGVVVVAARVSQRQRARLSRPAAGKERPTAHRRRRTRTLGAATTQPFTHTRTHTHTHAHTHTHTHTPAPTHTSEADLACGRETRVRGHALVLHAQHVICGRQQALIYEALECDHACGPLGRAAHPAAALLGACCCRLLLAAATALCVLCGMLSSGATHGRDGSGTSGRVRHSTRAPTDAARPPTETRWLAGGHAMAHMACLGVPHAAEDGCCCVRGPAACPARPGTHVHKQRALRVHAQISVAWCALPTAWRTFAGRPPSSESSSE
jgi:hypothetical protein